MPRQPGSRRGAAMVEFLVGCSVLLLLAMGTIQLSLLWSGQGAVETAAHFAARKFALHARTDFRKAKAVALAEASSICLHRFGGRWGSPHLTSIDFSRPGTGNPPHTRRGAYGQAALLLLPTLTAILSVVFAAVYVAHLGVEKIASANAVDAIALSAATWEARGLNLIAAFNDGIQQCFRLIRWTWVFWAAMAIAACTGVGLPAFLK